MKLIIQIPCFNERDQLGQAITDLPRSLPLIDEIEVLIIDDGSTDCLPELVTQLGIHHIVRFPKNRGLAAAFTAGLDAAVQLGADIIVNTDADQQYRGEDIARLIEPILQGRADLVIGDRQTDRIREFSPIKRLLQKWGSRMVRIASATNIADAPSGFRAMNRYAASCLFVHDRFTYTLETAIQAGRMGLAIENICITTNLTKQRPSKLFTSIPDYIRRAGPAILRSYVMYRPVQTFAYIAIILAMGGMILVVRFMYYYVYAPHESGHVQSLVVGIGGIILAFIVLLFALTAELSATNRRLLEEILRRTRKIEWQIADTQRSIPQLTSTGIDPWTPILAQKTICKATKNRHLSKII